MEEDLLKQRTQRWIVSLSVLILVGKFLAYYLTNSVGILTDAMESIVNVTAGFISLFSLYVSSKPKDKSHPFGHGKVELISASSIEDKTYLSLSRKDSSLPTRSSIWSD